MSYRRKAEPTQEQKERAAERRAQFRKLVETVVKMDDEARESFINRLGRVPTCQGHLLSVFNSCLLMMQLPTVTLVGGMVQWREVGRKVRKGEHGLMIWAASKHKASQSGGQEPTTQELESEKTTFFPVYVFDISQTEAMNTAESDLDQTESLAA